jgi:hypothetical protein
MKIIALLAAPFAALAISTAAYAAPTNDPFVITAQSTALSSGCHDWNPGAAPFASTAPESVAKLHSWLLIAVQEGKLTSEDAQYVEQYVHENPHGTPATIIRGAHFDFMASSERGKPVVSNLCYNPDDNAARTKDGNAISYKALNALNWVIKVPSGKTLSFNRFFICYNWAGEWIDVPSSPPPSETENCLTKHTQIPAGDYWLHQNVFGRYQIAKTCRNIARVEAVMFKCDSCTFDGPVHDLHAEGYIGGIQPNNAIRIHCKSKDGCEIVQQVPASAALRENDVIILDCISSDDGNDVVFTKDTHWYSWVNGEAYIGPAPAAWLAAGGVARPWVWKKK